ncbi:MAG: phosphatidylglycerophosphatase A [Betaproteobacteria bacterium HGW-Betaproteobacteria-11]|nr:MAG: phosphatidylglycerophosphatase A [Betaproteobacteria bacterium HGW-Betaproteobacteria-11]
MKIKPRIPGPPLRFLFQHPAHLVACGFGSGLSPFAPGTAGTLFAWATWPYLVAHFRGAGWLALFLLLAFAFGAVVCQITGRALGVVDHGAIVWDEIVPFWCVLLLTPAGLAWQLAAFLLFRFYDIAKPQPARWFDTEVKNGFGVMMDDLVAAGYTLFTLALAKMLLEMF